MRALNVAIKLMLVICMLPALQVAAQQKRKLKSFKTISIRETVSVDRYIYQGDDTDYLLTYQNQADLVFIDVGGVRMKHDEFLGFVIALKKLCDEQSDEVVPVTVSDNLRMELGKQTLFRMITFFDKEGKYHSIFVKKARKMVEDIEKFLAKNGG